MALSLSFRRRSYSLLGDYPPSRGLLSIYTLSGWFIIFFIRKFLNYSSERVVLLCLLPDLLVYLEYRVVKNRLFSLYRFIFMFILYSFTWVS